MNLFSTSLVVRLLWNAIAIIRLDLATIYLNCQVIVKCMFISASLYLIETYSQVFSVSACCSSNAFPLINAKKKRQLVILAEAISVFPLRKKKSPQFPLPRDIIYLNSNR